MEKAREILAKNLRRIADEKGLKQKALAKATKLDAVTVNRLFSGTQGVRDSNVDALAKAMECSVSNLYKETNPYAIPDFTAAASFLSKFEGLESDIQKLVLALVHNDLSYAKDVSPEFAKKCGPLLGAL